MTPESGVEAIVLPPPLVGIFFNHCWENSRIWALLTPSTTVPLEDLAWHLDLPVWTTVPGEPRFDLTPAEVLQAPDDHPRRWERLTAVDLSYPIEMFENRGRWVIVDGYHRLARHWLEGHQTVRVRMHPDECWDAARV